MRRILKNDASQKMSRAVTCKVSEKFHTREIAKSPFFAKKDMDCGLLPRSSRCPDDVASSQTPNCARLRLANDEKGARH